MNINEYVWVQLNEVGERILFNQRNKFLQMSLEEIREMQRFKNGWYRIQLWDLMHTFGDHLHMGCEVPFVYNEIMFFDPNETSEDAA